MLQVVDIGSPSDLAGDLWDGAGPGMGEIVISIYDQSLVQARSWEETYLATYIIIIVASVVDEINEYTHVVCVCVYVVMSRVHKAMVSSTNTVESSRGEAHDHISFKRITVLT